MSKSEEKDEGVPLSKDSLSEEHDSQSESERTEQKHSKTSSSMSLSSDRSMDYPLGFRQSVQGTEGSLLPSTMSMESDRSKDYPLGFKQTEQKPLPSSMSLSSVRSMDYPLGFRQSVQGTEGSLLPSTMSMESDRSKDYPLGFKQHDSVTEINQKVSKVSTFPQMDLDSIFADLEEKIYGFVKNELKRLHRFLSSDNPTDLESQAEDEELNDGEDDQRWSNRRAFLNITLEFMRKMKQGELANFLYNRTLSAMCQAKLKSKLKKKSQFVYEFIAKAGNPTLLNQIYTELYVTEGEPIQVNSEHEVTQIERASRKSHRSETAIRQEDIFKRSGEGDKKIRVVITKGVAGIGKTVLIQKFVLDWAEGKANQDIHFVFPFSFRELNVLKEKKLSLVDLVHCFFPETKEAEICRSEDFQIVFILDGLDECRLPLDFQKTEILTDVTESTSLNVLLTNIIRGKLLPSAHLWITTRPAAASQIPAEFVDMVTEVRGFTDTQKEEYFSKRFKEQEQASRIISHIKMSRSLHIMCHIPVFCWISASVLEEVLKTRDEGQLPKSLTEMYIHFLVVQSKLKNIKYDGGGETDPHWNPDTRKMIESLGKLAFAQLQKGNLIFYKSDLTDCGIDVQAASVYSGVFTQVFQEERGLYQDKVYCFVHLSIQEFLAAFHVHLTFFNSGVNLMSEGTSIWSRLLKGKPEPLSLYQSAVDKALQSSNGHLDLFLRFLLGLSLEDNQRLLQGLMKETGSSSVIGEKTVQYIKRKISETSCPEKCINLFHCLNELNDCSLMEEIQEHLRSGKLPIDKLSPAQWSALVFILLSSDEELDEFDLSKYFASEEVLLRLLPVVKASAKAVVSCFSLSDAGCEALASSICSQTSSLRDLDLSYNDLQDSGLKLLCEGFQSPQCTLETLRLCCCNLSERSCQALASVLSSLSFSLKELDLSNNDLQDSGVKLLCEGLQKPHCTLEALRLSGCLITKKGCTSVASALNANPVYLKVLDLTYNNPGDTGVKLLTAGRDNPDWGLINLRIDHGASKFLKTGLLKYARKLTLDIHTANKRLQLSDDNRKVAVGKEKQPYPDHSERFDYWKQVLCTDGLTDRCYWEVEWEGQVYVAVTYKGIRRRGDGNDSCLGGNDLSWSLMCSSDGYSFLHGNRITSVCKPPLSRVAVYLDWTAGILSFFNILSGKLIHIQTIHAKFTEPVYPAFRVKVDKFNSSVSLC